MLPHQVGGIIRFCRCDIPDCSPGFVRSFRLLNMRFLGPLGQKIPPGPHKSQMPRGARPREARESARPRAQHDLHQKPRQFHGRPTRSRCLGLVRAKTTLTCFAPQRLQRTTKRCLELRLQAGIGNQHGLRRRPRLEEVFVERSKNPPPKPTQPEEGSSTASERANEWTECPCQGASWTCATSEKYFFAL